MACFPPVLQIRLISSHVVRAGLPQIAAPLARKSPAHGGSNWTTTGRLCDPAHRGSNEAGPGGGGGEKGGSESSQSVLLTP